MIASSAHFADIWFKYENQPKSNKTHISKIHFLAHARRKYPSVSLSVLLAEATMPLRPAWASSVVGAAFLIPNLSGIAILGAVQHLCPAQESWCQSQRTVSHRSAARILGDKATHDHCEG